MTERRDVIRTRHLIEKAYYELLFKKNDKRITVNDILEEANISRGTFYAHYRDIPDLAEHVENLIINSLKDSLSDTTLDEIIDNPKEQVKMVLNMIIEHKDELKILLTNIDNPQIIQKLKRLLIQALSCKRLANTQLDKIDIIDSCVAAIIFDPCLYWILCDHPAKQDILIDTISDFLSGGLNKIFNSSTLTD